MANIAGKPMIGHVYERSAKSSLSDLTVVATCDQEIFDYIESIGGNATMTAPTHERASDRCAEALKILEEEQGVQYDVVVMVQGDEPLINPNMISEAVTPLLTDESINVINLTSEIESEAEYLNPNCIKVVFDLEHNALYFSRRPIPTTKDFSAHTFWKQVCIIPFRRDFLLRYCALEPTSLEVQESVDMMRILEHGFGVKMVPTAYQTVAVDTPEDLIAVEKLMMIQSGATK